MEATLQLVGILYAQVLQMTETGTNVSSQLLVDLKASLRSRSADIWHGYR